jgi:IS5 family transposase
MLVPASCPQHDPDNGEHDRHLNQHTDDGCERGFINRRYRFRGVVNEVERVKNRTKSKVRAKVEHPIGVIKRVFGFAKVRYRGLKKNAHRLIVTCALANLFMARRHLLRCQEA